MPSRAVVFSTVALVVLMGSTLPSHSQSEPRFVDVSDDWGLNGPLAGAYVHAGAWGDVDDDGLPDLLAGTFVTGPTTVPNVLVRNAGGSWESSGADTVAQSGRAAAAIVVDLDGDGDDDILVSNNRRQGDPGAAGAPSRLYRNDGGAFVDVTAGSGLEAQSARGRQVGVLDHDGDGVLDLFIVADSFGGGGPTVLLRGLGDLRYADVTSAASIPGDIHGLGLAVGDLTGNGWPDVFVAGGRDLTDPNPNHLLIANGDGTYRAVADHGLDWTPHTTGPEDWVSSGSIADVDRDGRLDLLVGHHFGSASENGPGAPIRLYLNRGVDDSGAPLLVDVTTEIGLPPIDAKAPHVEIQDFDNDGLEDLYTSVTVDGQPLIFHGRGVVDGLPRFRIPVLDDPHYHPVGPSADIDLDGRLDLFLGEFRSVFQGTSNDLGVVDSVLLRNTLQTGNWIDVSVDTPTAGIGARVSVYENGRAGRVAHLLGSREIQVGNGFSSSSRPIAHFGLGDVDRVDIVVSLPGDGGVITRSGVGANGHLRVAAPPADAWWPLDDGAGTIAADRAGVHHARVVGGSWVKGIRGAGIRLAGNGHRIEVPAGALDGATDLTFAAWIRPGAKRTQWLLGSAGDSHGSEYDLRVFRRRLIIVRHRDHRWMWNVPALGDGAWHHLALVRDGRPNTITLYLDGAPLRTRPAVVEPLRVDHVFIGADLRAAGTPRLRKSWKGRADEITVHRRALTTDEIGRLHAGGP